MVDNTPPAVVPTPEPEPEPEPEQQEGVLSFTAVVEDCTRTYVLEQGDAFNIKWIGNEQLVVEAEGSKYIFSNSKSKLNTVTCQTEGVTSLIGKSARIVYTADSDSEGTVDSTLGSVGLKLGATATIEAGCKVTLKAECAIIIYCSAAEAVLTAKAVDGSQSSLFYKDGAAVSSITVAAGNDLFVPIAATESAEGQQGFEVVCTVGESEVKKETIVPVYGKVYDLGILSSTQSEPTPEPEPEPELQSVYLVPNDDWKTDNAWFAAYFFNNGGRYLSFINSFIESLRFQIIS